MRRVTVLIVSAIIILAGLFVPTVQVDLIPESSFRLAFGDGQPVSDVGLDQRWKDYSLEFWRNSEHVDHSVRSDVNGVVVLPARGIRVAAVQFLAAKIRDCIAALDPHASYGPHSYIMCQGSLDCDASYSVERGFPKVVIVKQ
jgi:hypothetical protein